MYPTKSKQPTGSFMISLVHLDRSVKTPLVRQLAEALQRAILSRQLSPGWRLPSTREWARALGVSRNTVKSAYEALLSEGYLTAQVGAGTFVTQRLPEYFSRPAARETSQTLVGKRPLSRWGQALAELGVAGRRMRPLERPHLFSVAQPDLEAFPCDLWARFLARAQRTIPVRKLGYHQDPLGYLPLREAIATHLRVARSVRCEVDQVALVAGAQQGLMLVAYALLDPGKPVWIEEPGYNGAKGVLLFRRADLVPVPVDAEGLIVCQGVQRQPRARLAVVTPSHQYPLGHTLSLARRAQLLQWAEQVEGWIVEDDYDSEFRYREAPLAALQGLDGARRVIYLGTLSKVLFPALRLGYLVLPPDLVDAFAGLLLALGGVRYPVVQAALADFMNEGHFSRHVRRMRQRYLRRRDALLDALQTHLGDAVEVGPADCGMHLTVMLPRGVRDAAVAARLPYSEAHQARLSTHYLNAPRRQGLLLGFSHTHEGQIRRDAAHLARSVEEVWS